MSLNIRFNALNVLYPFNLKGMESAVTDEGFTGCEIFPVKVFSLTSCIGQ